MVNIASQRGQQKVQQRGPTFADKPEMANLSKKEPGKVSDQKMGELAKPYAGANLGASQATPQNEEGAASEGASTKEQSGSRDEGMAGGGGGGLSTNDQRQAANQMRQQKVLERKKQEKQGQAVKQTAKDEAKKKAKKSLVKKLAKSTLFKAALPWIISGSVTIILLGIFGFILVSVLLHFGPIVKAVVTVLAKIGAANSAPGAVPKIGLIPGM